MLTYILIKRVIAILLLAICVTPAFASSADGICAGFSRYLSNQGELKLPNSARDPTERERQLIEKSNIDLLQHSDYDMGTSVVDADNDGKDEIFVWNVDGTGRFAEVELFEMGTNKDGRIDNLIYKGGAALGVLMTPYFVRFKDSNYLISTDTGDKEGLRVSQIKKLENGKHQSQTICNMKTVVTPDAQCRHPACKELQHEMSDRNTNEKFINVAWPHKYFAPAGLEAYFGNDEGDFDNTGQSSVIWRIGSADRRVLPESQHNRLRKVLNQQSVILSTQLHQPITLPKQGEFFLFQANENRTYWAWDFGEPPYGSEIHIMYSNATHSDYIGVVRSARKLFLEPCKSDCVRSLSQ